MLKNLFVSFKTFINAFRDDTYVYEEVEKVYEEKGKIIREKDSEDQSNDFWDSLKVNIDYKNLALFNKVKDGEVSIKSLSNQQIEDLIFYYRTKASIS